jgi:NADH dehydrogenase FAD-containing subunit
MIRHLVLLGAGSGHLRFLHSLKKKRSPDIAITLVTRVETHIDDAHFLRALASRAPMAHCGELLEPLLRQTHVNWLDQHVQAIDASAKVLLLDDGRELRFDWLSIDMEPAPNRDLADRLMPGARANGLFLRPREAFCKLWPKVAELAAQRPQRVAIISGRLMADENQPRDEAATAPMALALENGNLASAPPLTPPPAPPSSPLAASVPDWAHEKGAIELAFAVRQAFTSAAVTLITGGQPVAMQASPALRAGIQQALKKHRITVLADAACAVQPGAVHLQSGAQLACDVPLLALQGPAHPLLASSGLALYGTGPDFGNVDVDGGQRSRSHAYVFAANGADTAGARGRELATSLQAVVAGKQSAIFRQQASALLPEHFQTLRCSPRHAIVSWRSWAWSCELLGGMMP